jgi:hypothetical protein
MLGNSFVFDGNQFLFQVHSSHGSLFFDVGQK